jgi:hypothetical protein
LSDVSSASAARTNLGLGAGDTPTFAGVDITGTITSDGLTVSNNAAGIADAIELENFSGESSYIKAKRGLTLSADYDNNSAAVQSNITFETDGTERMRIDSSGNVGIRTASPDAPLTVKGQTVIGSLVAESANLSNLTSGTPPQLIAGWSVPAITWSPASSTEAVFTRDGHMQIDILAGANGFSTINFSDPDDEDVGQVSYAHSTDSMIFRTNNAERMRIDSSGNVGIGTANPTTALDVDGTVTATSYAGDGSNLTGISAGATGGGTDKIFVENGQVVTADYTVSATTNAMTTGPIDINSGVTVTVETGGRWVVI